MRTQSLTDADKALLAKYPRDFKAIPAPTQLGEGIDAVENAADRKARIDFLKERLIATLNAAVEKKERPIFTIALIAGDCVILDAIHKAGLIDKISIVFIDTYTLFPETMAFLRQVEDHYGFKAHVYHAKGIESQAEYEQKYGKDYWRKDIEEYDQLCKVEPLQRALGEHNSDCWINGRRRDHGAERAALAVWEGKKLNPLAYWSFEDCWEYLRENNVPYHPLHDVGYSSLGDAHSTLKVDLEKWFTYGGERSGRFVGLVNKDGSAKTECGIHSGKRPKSGEAKKSKKARLSNDMETPQVTSTSIQSA